MLRSPVEICDSAVTTPLFFRGERRVTDMRRLTVLPPLFSRTLGVALGLPILAVRIVDAPAPTLAGEALLTGGGLGPMSALPALGGQLVALVAVVLFGPTPDPWMAELWDRHVRGSRPRGGR